MDEGLFAKHLRTIHRKGAEKNKIIESVLTATGVQVEESDIVVSKKTITLSLSSAKRAALLQKGLIGALEAIGYRLA